MNQNVIIVKVIILRYTVILIFPTIVLVGISVFVSNMN